MPVMIYNDPLTKEYPEGEAELIQYLGTDESSGLESWVVRFVEDRRGGLFLRHLPTRVRTEGKWA